MLEPFIFDWILRLLCALWKHDGAPGVHHFHNPLPQPSPLVSALPPPPPPPPYPQPTSKSTYLPAPRACAHLLRSVSVCVYCWAGAVLLYLFLSIFFVFLVLALFPLIFHFYFLVLALVLCWLSGVLSLFFFFTRDTHLITDELVSILYAEDFWMQCNSGCQESRSSTVYGVGCIAKASYGIGRYLIVG